MPIPNGAEVARPFLPTRDFDKSRAPYEALGFEKLLDGDVATFGVGQRSFIPQRHFHPEWAENCMMQLMVDDLDAWRAHLERSPEFVWRETAAPSRNAALEIKRLCRRSSELLCLIIHQGPPAETTESPQYSKTSISRVRSA
jgi:hypothetical protein